MTATRPEDVRIEREIPGIGNLIFEQTHNRDGSTRARDYWLLPEGAQHRRRMGSVTEILAETWPTSHQMQEWMKREGLNANNLRDAGARRGTTIHSFIERYLVEGDLLPFAEFPADYLPFFEACAHFLWEHDPELVDTERLVCHPELGYAGRLDTIMTLRRVCGEEACYCAPFVGVPTLWDYKTSAGGRVYLKAHAQVGAYHMADERCRSGDAGSGAIEKMAILGISENGRYTIVESPIEDSKKLWVAALDFHREMGRFERALRSW